MTVIRTSSEQQRVLKLLASNRHGVNEEMLLRRHGFSRGVLSSLVRRRLAATGREVVMAGGKAIEVVRFRITAAGRGRLRASCDPRENTVDIIALRRVHDNRRQTSQINCCRP